MTKTTTVHEVCVEYKVTYAVFIEGTYEDAQRFARVAPVIMPDDDFDAILLAATQDADVVVVDATELEHVGDVSTITFDWGTPSFS